MRYLFICICLITSVTSLLKLRALNSYEDARNDYKDFKANNIQISYEELAYKINHASSLSSRTTSSKELQASFLQDIAKLTDSTETKLKALCKASSSLLEALKDRPYDSKILINLADVSQLLKGSECSNSFLNYNFSEIINSAVGYDPFNPDILYASGLLYSWNQDPENSIRVFNKLLSLANKLNDGKKNTIIEIVDSGEKFQQLVPKRFPQIITWVRLLKEKNTELYNESDKTIEKMQLEALENNLSNLQNKLISKDLYLQNLLGMLESYATDDIRKTCMGYLSNLLGSSSAFGNYYESLSKLNRIKTINAYKIYDTLPLRGALSDWNNPNQVVFDADETSVGFFKSESDDVKIITLASNKKARPLIPSDLKFFVSDNNQNWTEVNFTAKVIDNYYIDKSIILIYPSDYRFKYFKVLFDSQLKASSFYNDTREIISAYG